MLEKDFNHDIVSYLNKDGWAYKIPDPDHRAMSSGGRRPFDGFAFIDGQAFYFESKLMKEKLSAFSLDRIEDQQYENLLKLRRLGAETAVLLAFWCCRKDYKILSLDIEFLWSLRSSRKSLLGSELKQYLAQGMFLDMRKGFRPSDLINKRVDRLPGGEYEN